MDSGRASKENADMEGFPIPTDRTSGERFVDLSAEERLASLRRLVHDLHNALSVVSINSALMGGGVHPDEHADMLEEIRDSSMSAAAILRQMRRYIGDKKDFRPARAPAQRLASGE